MKLAAKARFVSRWFVILRQRAGGAATASFCSLSGSSFSASAVQRTSFSDPWPSVTQTAFRADVALRDPDCDVERQVFDSEVVEADSVASSALRKRRDIEGEGAPALDATCGPQKYFAAT